MIVENPALMPTNVEYAIDLDEVDAELCRRSFFHFVKTFWDVVVPEEPVYNWHIKYLCDEFQKSAETVFEGKPREHDTITNISPGTTKSTIYSVMATPWIWTRMFTARVIGASFTADLSLELATKSRDIVLSERYQRYFPEIEIRPDKAAKSNFQNTKGGQRIACGVGGNITGKHAHFIIIDDPIDPQAANAISEKEINEVNEWVVQTISKRKVDKQVTFTQMVMQRLHQNDPTGYRLGIKSMIPINHICLPAEETDEIRPPELRDEYIDGLMDPVRLNRLVLEEERALSNYAYASQFLQTPIPLGGGMFETEKFQIKDPPRKFKRVVWYIDKAATDGGGAYSVMLKMGEDFEECGVGKHKHGRFWVLDVIRGQWGVSKREEIFKATLDQDLPSDNEIINQRYLKTMQVGVEQEPGSGGLESAENTVRHLAGYRVKKDRPSGDKTLRAETFATQVGNGSVYLARGDWNAEYIKELRYFPFSTYKDQVDASSGAFKLLYTPKRIAGAPWRNK